MDVSYSESKFKLWVIQLSFPEHSLYATGCTCCASCSVAPARSFGSQRCIRQGLHLGVGGSTLWPSDRQQTQAASPQTQAGIDDVLTTSTALRPLLRLPTSFSSSARLWGGGGGTQREGEELGLVQGRANPNGFGSQGTWVPALLWLLTCCPGKSPPLCALSVLL